MKTVDIHDAEVISFQRTRGRLVVNLQMWNEKIISLVFTETFQSREIDCIGATLQKMADSVDSIYLNDARSLMRDLGCSEDEVLSMRHYSLISTDDLKVLEVISSAAEVSTTQ